MCQFHKFWLTFDAKPFFFRQIVDGLRHGLSFIKEEFNDAICFFGYIDCFWIQLKLVKVLNVIRKSKSGTFCLEIRLFCEKVATVPFFFRQIVEGLRHGQSFIKEEFGYTICFFGCIDRFWSERFQHGSGIQIIFLQFTKQIFQCQPYFKNSIFYLISH